MSYPVYSVSDSKDFSKTRESEQLQQFDGERFQNMVIHSPDILVLHREGRIIYANPAAFRLLRAKSEDDIVGRSPLDFFHPSQHESILARIELLRASPGMVPAVEETIIALDGTMLEVEVFASSFYTGDHLDIQVVCRDITERNAMKQDLIDRNDRQRVLNEELRVNQERFCLLAQATNDAIWDWNLETGELWWGEGLEKLFGYKREEINASVDSWTSRIHPKDRDFVVERILQVIDEGGSHWSAEYDYLCKGGSYTTVADRGCVVRDEEGRALRMVGGMTDISQRISNESKLVRQAALLDHARDAIIVRDLENRVCSWNKGAEKIYGWSEGEVLGKRLPEILETTEEDYENLRRDALMVGEWRGELRHQSRTGVAIRVLGSWSVLYDDDGAPESVLEINTDITELKKMEEQFLRAQRLESIGRLAGGIAHDLNNVLAPIIMSFELLEKEITHPEGRAILDTVRTSANHGVELVKQVLGYARGKHVPKAKTNPTQVAKDIYKVVTDTFPKHIRASLKYEEPVWDVCSDSTQLHQILMNLCVNGRDAMPEGGSLCLSFENVIINEYFPLSDSRRKPGSYVVMSVEDSGSGMSEVVRSKIFEPFFTTKDFGRGTGLGLSTVHTIVQNLGGFINLYSELGQGTNFRVYLPACAAEGADEKTSVSEGCSKGNGELILLVDDDESIRKVAKLALESFGYKVALASNGAEGVATFLQRKGEIDLVLTDMSMPVMDGPSMIVAIQSLDPKVRVVCSSGLSSNEAVARALSVGVEHFVPKPYMLKTLLRCIDKVLHGGLAVLSSVAAVPKDPVASTETTDLVAPAEILPASSSHTSVLFVDDEPNLRKLGKTILTRAGFSVLIADDALSALTTLEQHQGKIDVLISDVNMPGMNGFSLAERVALEYPLVKIILSSGDPNTASEEGCSKKFSFKTLNKPYSVRELTSAVEAVISHAPL